MQLFSQSSIVLLTEWASLQLLPHACRNGGVAPGLIRLSVGIEDVEDILDDIRQALDKI